MANDVNRSTPVKVFFGSLIFFLVLVEIGLRLGGYIYLNRLLARTEKTIKTTSHSRPYTILTLGDSYTVGGEGKWEDNYPSHLQRILQKNHPNQFLVVNGGICEANSTQTLQYFLKLIKEYQVDSVILLTGSTNAFNFIGLNDQGIFRFFSDLRILKLLKIFTVNLKGKLLQKKAFDTFNANQTIAVNRQGQFSDNNYHHCPELKKEAKRNKNFATEDKSSYFQLGMCYLYQKDFVRAEEIFKQLVENGYYYAYRGLIIAYDNQKKYDQLNKLYPIIVDDGLISAWPYLEFAKSYIHRNQDEKALALFQKALTLENQEADAYKALGDYYVLRNRENEALDAFLKALEFDQDEHVIGEVTRLYFEQGQFELALEYILKSIELFSSEFTNYYGLLKAYEFQNKYDAKYISDFLRKVANKNPLIYQNPTFHEYLDYLYDQQEHQKKIYDHFRGDLDKIYELCRQNNIKLIVQDYPYPYHKVNKLLLSFAQKHALTFVTQHTSFKGLENNKEYFYDSDHSTKKGHRMMAENIYEVIKKEIINK